MPAAVAAWPLPGWDGVGAAAFAWCLLIAAVGGLVRGATGFGASMVMAAPLSLLIGPRIAVPVTLLLETFAAAPMIPAAIRAATWRTIGPIGVAAVLAVPAGSWLLAVADADTLRRAIAATVVVCSLLLLIAGRWRRAPQRPATSVGLGLLSGTMLGATGIGGPPVILYLMAGPDPVGVTRANLTLYVMLISAAGLAGLWWNDLLPGATLAQAGWLAAPFAAGIIIGSGAFARFSDHRFRQATIGLMLLVSLWILVS